MQIPILWENTDYPNYTFERWAYLPRHIIDVLIFKDSTRFDNILKKLVKDVFNPATLYPYIDELKEFVRPYVELDKIPNENGKYPGRNHEEAGDYSLAQWDANCEFTSVNTSQNSRAYGLKYWILAKYRFVCEAYNIECDPVYIDESYEYPIDKSVESPLEEDAWINWDSVQPVETETTSVEPQPTETTTVKPQPTETTSVEPQPTETTEAAKTTTTTITKTKTTKTKTTKTKKTKTTKTKKTKTTKTKKTKTTKTKKTKTTKTKKTKTTKTKTTKTKKN